MTEQWFPHSSFVIWEFVIYLALQLVRLIHVN
jgi:hypothetical protein